MSSWEVLGAAAQATLSNLQVNINGRYHPEFAWVLKPSSDREFIPTSFQLFLSRHQAGASDVWSSGAVLTNTSRPIEYDGPPLSSHARYFWRIQIETTAGPVAASSEFATGTLSASGLHAGQLIEQRQAVDALVQSFQSASWIWTSEAESPIAPVADRAFRRTYDPPTGKSASFADIIITADDQFALYVNGGLAGSTLHADDEFGWKTAWRYHVPLGSKRNVFAVHGVNLHDRNTGQDSPAGLLVAIQITQSDGSTTMLTSDSNWRISKDIPVNFEASSFDDSSWDSASSIGNYGVNPWARNVVIPTTVNTVNLPTPTPPASATPSKPTPPSSSSTRPSSSQVTTATPNSAIDSASVTTSMTASPATSGSMSSTTATSSVSVGGQQAPPAAKSSTVGPIVGGVIGGIAIIGLMVLLILCQKRLRRSRRANKSALNHLESSPSVISLQPFLMSEDERGGSGASTSQHNRSLYPVRKPDLKTSGAMEHYQDSDSGSAGGGVVGSGVEGSLQSRSQRLQSLRSELNGELARGGEGSPYVSELRGRIAELTRGLGTGGYRDTVPPPYQSPTGEVNRGTPPT
ncbi:hypothetical protein FPV67DRAFT_1106939 [Lyophyllum atratum]|nr:hypothetical protein FPV67DRAFT_1106939 [Lyophyllum atratum]